jgi:hypothetical protein
MARASSLATELPKRLVKVSVGPAGTEALLLDDDFDLTFNIQVAKGQRPTVAEVTIANLSRATIESQLEAGGVQADDLVLIIEAGEDVLGTLFRGTVNRRGIETKNDIPERSTTIKAADGRRVWRDTLFSASWPAGTAVAQAFQALISASGLPVAFSSPLPAPAVTFTSTWTVVGRWRKALTELATAFGYTWWIDRGSLYLVFGADDPSRGNATLISPATGLIGSPTPTTKGADFEVMLGVASKIRPGHPVVIESQFFDGLYRTETIAIVGTTEGRQWKATVQTELVK